jgi:hypothetical protein
MAQQIKEKRANAMLQAAHSSQVRRNPVGGILFTPRNAQRELAAV